MSDSNERQIHDMVVKWTEAVASGDREGILAQHATDMLMYDFPSTVRGLGAYSKTWDFFDASRTGAVTFDPRDISVKADATLAFVTCEIHCDGTAAGPLDFRLTTCLEKRNGAWVITHEHHSVPTTDERLTGPDVKAQS